MSHDHFKQQTHSPSSPASIPHRVRTLKIIILYRYNVRKHSQGRRAITLLSCLASSLTELRGGHGKITHVLHRHSVRARPGFPVFFSFLFIVQIIVNIQNKSHKINSTTRPALPLTREQCRPGTGGAARGSRRCKTRN